MVEVKVSEDGMMAEVALHPEPEEEMTVETIENMLRLEGVQAGIDKVAIAYMLAREIYDQFKTVAKGKAPVDGEDAYYEFFFAADANNGKPTIKEDGTVDYSFKIVNVSEGDLLAEYHPETGGVFGYNVFSKMLKPKRGKALRPLRCLDVRMEDNKYYAGINGHIMLSDDTLSVQNVLEIKGDTAYNDGDINFNGDVHVIGNICNGVTVRAAGSVIVDGVIENAKIYAGLDVVVSQGIHGKGIVRDGQQNNTGQLEMSTVVEAKGQLKSKFIDHAFVRTEGDIFIDYAIGSIIASEGKVTAFGARGAIIGGNVMALMGVEAETLGNTAEVITEITVGYEKGFMDKHSKVGEKLHDLEENFSEYQARTEPERVREILEQTKKCFEVLERKFRDSQIAPVIVRKMIYPNVKLRFGKMAVPDCRGKFNVELRKIVGQVLCKTIGTFTEAELACGLVDKNVQAEVEKRVVLIIDDDTRLLRTVHGILESVYQVAVATSGRVARKYLEKNFADLILLDYMMPEENGVEVLKSLRANEDTKDIPVVFLTGLDDKKKIMECLSLHPAGYIMKPVERDSLLAKIHAILGDKAE